MTITGPLRSSLAGRYAVEREIGRGGMATVYLARDLRHDRLVALKVLDPELGAVLGAGRFLGEIKTTAGLQHPHLLPLFDSGEADGLLFYTMPFVDGESLRARLDRERQLPVAEAVRIAAAVADALEHAHRRGVVHRDLKPENVLLDRDGHVLVADFGIALAVSRAGGARVTQTGLSLGTPQYMSPEQAAADRALDARSDVYSLGAVAYEMLAGEPPHVGPTVQAIVARVLTETPRDLRLLRPAVPEPVARAVARALEKLPADRWQTAREFGEALRAGEDTPVPGAPPRAPAVRRRRDPLVLALAATSVASLGLAAWGWRRALARPEAAPARFVLAPPAGLRLDAPSSAPVIVAPDGGALLFSAAAPGARRMLYYRPLAELAPRPLAGTEDAASPAFSPDGRRVAFFVGLTLRTVSVGGGDVTDVATVRSWHSGIAWTRAGELVFGSEQGLWRVPATGGTPTPLTRVDTTRGEVSHWMPRPLPDGTSLVYAVSRSGAANPASLSLVSLATGETTPLDVSAYAPLGTRGAWLLVERRDGVTGSIAAVPFDARRRRVGTTSVTLAQGLTFRTTVGLNASLADDGSLVYTRGVPGRRLAITDAGGAITATFPETRGFFDPHVSPDGRRVAVVVAEAGGADAPTADVWVYDVGSETPSRLTAGQLVRYVAWAPGGTRLVYVQNPVRGPSEIWTVSGDGSGAAERLYAAPEGVRIQSPPSYVDDGRAVIFEAIDQRTRRHEIWRVRLDSAGGAAGAPLLRSPFDLEDPQVSPDGRWLAYSSDETGQLEVYVRAYPALDRRVRISAAGGIAPTWASDGRRLFYQESETSGGLLAAAVAAASGSLAVTERREVLATSGGERPIAGWGDYDVRPGGAGFVLVRPVEERGQELVLVQHWDRELRARAGGR